MQYNCENAQYPDMVIEITRWTSKKIGGKDLMKLADQYIVNSSGDINLVVG